MRVISKKALVECYTKHPTAKSPLEAWHAEAKSATWRTPSDIKAKFRSADFLQDNRVVFNIGGNKYRLVVKVAYRAGIVYVRFVGTHREYDRIDAESV